MADKSSQLVLDALSRAAADPAGVPLFQQKAASGLFTGTALARQAAQRCKEQDLLGVVSTAARGKAVQEIVAITPKGMDHLLAESNPRQVLGDLVRALESREKQVAEWIASARQAQASLEALKSMVAKVLQRIELDRGPSAAPRPQTAPVQDVKAVIVRYLEKWCATNTAEDCPLPHLYRQLIGLSIGQFHDTLRELYALQRIYLHPWTGPLCDLPEPPLALMVGHEIAYYASPRRDQ